MLKYTLAFDGKSVWSNHLSSMSKIAAQKLFVLHEIATGIIIQHSKQGSFHMN